MASRLVWTSATDATTRMRCFGGCVGVDLLDHEVVRVRVLGVILSGKLS